MTAPGGVAGEYAPLLDGTVTETAGGCQKHYFLSTVYFCSSSRDSAKLLLIVR